MKAIRKTALVSVALIVSVGACRSEVTVEDELPPSTGAMTSDAPTPELAPEAGPTQAEAVPQLVPQIEVVPDRDRRPATEASRELAMRLGLAPPDPLFVSDLLTRSDVRELTGYTGDLLETSLGGITPSPDYNAIRIQAAGGYGFALQVWQFDEVRQLSTQFRRLRETYFDSRLDPAGVANEAFSAEFQQLRHYAFLHRAAKSMAVVTCESRYCDSTQIRALAQRVANRL